MKNLTKPVGNWCPHIKKGLLIMRLSVLLILIAVFSSTASVYSQATRLTVKMENVRLSEVFDVIEKQSEFYFFYNRDYFNDERIVSLDIEDKKIDEVLAVLFEGESVNYEIFDRNILIKVPDDFPRSSQSGQQQRAVSGRVTDNDGQPLPGVTVVVKGSTQGTITDSDGNYSMSNLPDNAILQFSFVGMRMQEIPVGNQTTINVTLEEETIGIEEVVAVGYGVQKKVNLTGSVAAISGTELVNKPVTGTMDALQGVMPGVVVTRSSGAPGQEDYEIQIRGFTSVNANPVLVLVDGIEGNIEDVRPEDVESISVLKDAASAAIYGAKAAGGVVLVTTKRGKAGKISVEVNSHYSVAKIGRLPERVSSYEAALMRNEADLNSGGSATYSEENLANLADPDVLWTPLPSNPNLYWFWGDYDYKKLVLKDSPMMSHNIAVSGGNESTVYRLSTTYYSNEGSVKIGPDSNTKYSGRLNLDTRISDYFHLSNILSYSSNKIEKPVDNLHGAYGLFAYVFTYPGFTPLYDPNGHQVEGITDGRIKFYDFSYDHGIREWKQNNVRANSTLTIRNLVKGLQFRLVGGIDANFDNIFEHEKAIEEYGIDGTQVGFLTSNTYVKRGQTNSSLSEFQFLTDYNLEANSHTISLLAGYSIQDFRSESFDAMARSLVNDDLPDFDWASIENTDLNDRVATNRFQSLFGRFAYNYDNRYLFEANVRYDGSSKLDPHDQYRLFPSASAAWRVSEENWFNNEGIMNEFKFRVSYGQLGNAGVLGNYDYIALLNAANDVVIGHSGTEELQKRYVYQNQLASKNITWETVQNANVGVDLGFLNNRLTITGDYFVKNNKDMLARVAYPSVIGINVGNLNVGELKTWGWEAYVGWKDRRGSFSYWANANVADAQNELIEYYGADVVSPGTVRLLQGYPINSIWGFKTDGLFQSEDEVDNHVFQSNATGAGDVRYINLDGDDEISTGRQTVEDPGDMVYLGNTNPRYTFGLQGGFDWKGLDFSVFFQGVGKRVFLVDNTQIEPYQRPWFGPQKHNLDYWTPDNRDAFWPRLYVRGEHNFRPSDKWLQNAAYIRLKDIQIGYTLSDRLLSVAGIERVRIYVAGHDVWEATKVFDFIDPEKPNQSTYQYPFRRSYTVGLNLNF